LSTAEHASIDATVLRTGAPPAHRRRSRALARPCGIAARVLIVGGWGVAAAASLRGGLLGPFCAAVALAVLLGAGASSARIARASAALAAVAAAICVVASQSVGDLELAGLTLSLAGSALTLPAAALSRPLTPPA
jgi:hypothetical protein